jgi:hypothetical protein
MSKCMYCQTGKHPSYREKHHKIEDDERKCRRCLSIMHLDEFIWSSKDGKRTKFIKTCQSCRITDKSLRSKHKSKKSTIPTLDG